jgi:hypothetical protein
MGAHSSLLGMLSYRKILGDMGALRKRLDLWARLGAPGGDARARDGGGVLFLLEFIIYHHTSFYFFMHLKI